MKSTLLHCLLIITPLAQLSAQTYVYDNANRVGEIQHANGYNISYSYDKLGNRNAQALNSNAISPDLQLLNVTLNSSSISPSQVIYATLTNINGGSSTAGNHKIKAWLSTNTILNSNDILLDSILISSVGPAGAHIINAWPIVIPQSTTTGSYYLLIKTDANNSITETNESNNLVWTPLSINNCTVAAVAIASSQPSCNTSNGIISLNCSGGVSPYQYSINSGASWWSTNTFNSLPAGTYICKAKDANGCIDSDTVILTPANTTTPSAQFSPTISGLNITVGNGSTAVTNYYWTFGDGNSATSSNPSHTYLASGTYIICLTATNSCGSSQVCDTVIVTAGNTSQPCNITSSFTQSKLQPCKGDTVLFTSTATGGGTLQWMVNGLAMGSQTTYSNIFSNPGTYTVSLVSSSSVTCRDTFSQTVTILADPAIASVASPSACASNSGSLLMQVIGGVSPYSYSLDSGLTFSNSNLLTSLAPGQRSITVKNGYGCFFSHTATIPVSPPSPVVIIGSPQPACFGGQLTFSTGAQSVVSYQWRKNSQPIAGATGPTYTIPSLAPSDSGNVYDLVVTNTAPCPGVTSNSFTLTPVKHQWTGTLDTAWTASENWNNCGKPTASSSVLVPIAAPHMPVVSTSESIWKLESHGTVTVQPPGELVILGQ